MQDAVIAHARSAFESYSNNGKNIRVGNAFPTVPDMLPMDLFPTKSDGKGENWAVIGCLGEPMFELLCKAMDMPEILEDPRFKDQKIRANHKDELTAIVTEWASKFTSFELMDYLLRKNRVVCSAVYTIQNLIEADDLRNMGLIQKIEDPELGEMWYPAFSAIYSDIDIKAKNPGGINASNEEILTGFLGLSAKEYADLSAKKVI
jgi:crotonobetainyl-CoA:carnitine CoA-transferase CaiB-like acyl-CoA transferase